ncbi:hypothetical protein HJG60_010983 [Phyllostomus discolor]|uniref:Uncharacterized protein n=1 Tax=Phyllostomus discolor TaxID=89673 RepID=A0A834E6M8_9CHIR|nr:hypothetical protein HJG60_010983 [Phyllostomus discolor]
MHKNKWNNKSTSLPFILKPIKLLKIGPGALAIVAQWLQCQSLNQRVTGSVPGMRPDWESNQRPFGFAGPCLIHQATPARAIYCYFSVYFFYLQKTFTVKQFAMLNQQQPYLMFMVSWMHPFSCV